MRIHFLLLINKENVSEGDLVVVVVVVVFVVVVVAIKGTKIDMIDYGWWLIYQ